MPRESEERGRSASSVKVLIQYVGEAALSGSDGCIIKPWECNVCKSAHVRCLSFIICSLSNECRETSALTLNIILHVEVVNKSTF